MMTVFKCKMCGSTIEFEKGDTVGTCDSCGTKQTLPRLDDDRKANLFDRANHFRRANDFDKAESLYERILSEDPTDAEAYWSLVLCRYGIEYVEDPATHRRVPTVNRAQFTSIFDDENYKSALKYGDTLQRVIYQEEAAAINDIQKERSQNNSDNRHECSENCRKSQRGMDAVMEIFLISRSEITGEEHTGSCRKSGKKADNQVGNIA